MIQDIILALKMTNSTLNEMLSIQKPKVILDSFFSPYISQRPDDFIF